MRVAVLGNGRGDGGDGGSDDDDDHHDDETTTIRNLHHHRHHRRHRRRHPPPPPHPPPPHHHHHHQQQHHHRRDHVCDGATDASSFVAQVCAQLVRWRLREVVEYPIVCTISARSAAESTACRCRMAQMQNRIADMAVTRAEHSYILNPTNLSDTVTTQGAWSNLGPSENLKS